MRTLLPLLSLVGVLSSPTFAENDLIRFTNGDQLHGKFLGLQVGPSITWKREDLAQPAVFQSSDLRQVILHAGAPEGQLRGLSYVGTVNGDRIPGDVVALDDETVTVETEFAGTLVFPRAQVGLISPNPLGGGVRYQGPFSANEWTMISQKYPEGFPETPDEKEALPKWNFLGASWYWQDNPMGTALVQKEGLPDKAIIRFKLAWKNRQALTIGFHSDFSKPPAKEDEDEEKEEPSIHPGNPNYITSLFGNSYVLQLHSHYAVLCRSYFTEEGTPVFERVQTTNTNVQLGDAGEAVFEIRCNRLSGEIVLFIDGEFVAQWSEIPKDGEGELGYVGKGDGLGFFAQSDQTTARISDIVIAEWNGMPDAARSLQVDESDVILLNNGTDRFSGDVVGIQDGQVTLKSRYGNFMVPIVDISEIRFAKNKLDEKVSEESKNTVKVRFRPYGRITGKPVSGAAAKITIAADSVGEVEISLDSATMLEFETAGSFVDDWDNDF